MNYDELTDDIKKAYTDGVTLDEAERLAAKFLHAQMHTIASLSVQSLDARMRKSGLKAVRAAVYLEAAKKGDKKPSDVMLNAEVEISKLVETEQKDFDSVEVSTQTLENYLSVFKEAHIYFRGIAKGSLNG